MLKLSKLIVLAAFLVLSGCKFHVAPDVYLSDMMRLNSNSPMTTTITLSVPVITEDNCEERRNIISTALSAGFGNLRYRGCEEIGSEDYVVFQADTVIAELAPNAQFARFVQDKPAISLFTVRENADQRVYAVTNNVRLSAMRDALAQQNSHYADESRRLDMKLTINIVNDTRLVQIIATDGAFFNGDPVYWRRTFELDHRQSATVSASDVANGAFKRGDAVVMFTLLDVQEIPDTEKTPSQLQEALPEE